LQTRDPTLLQVAREGFRLLDDEEEYNRYFPTAPRAPQPSAPAAAAPAAPPAPTTQATGLFGRQMTLAAGPGAMPEGYGGAMPAPVNALPSEPAAPVNAMAVASAAQGDPLAARRQELTALMGSSNARVKARAKAELDAMPKPPEAVRPVVVGGRLVDPTTRQVVYEPPPEAEKPTTNQRDYEFAKSQGYKGSFEDFKKLSATNVNLPPQEKAEKSARGGFLVKQYEIVSDAARLASRTLPSLDTQSNILDKGFKTGFGTDVQKAGASLLASLGVPEAAKFATDAQTFLAAAQQAVLQKQLEQKGVQTQADADRITQTGAQLGNTPEANRFIIDVTRAQLKRDIEQRNFYDKWWKSNGTYDGAEDAWFAGEGGKSLFDRAELKKYAAARPAAAPTAAATAAPTTGVGPYRDAEKERRYQEWKRKQGAR